MKNGEVIDAADRFIARRQQPDITENLFGWLVEPMPDGQVVEATDRFTAQSQPTDSQIGEGSDNILDFDSYYAAKTEIIEAAVEQSAGQIAVILQSNGYTDEAYQIRERANQFVREGIPTTEIYELFYQYFKEAHPKLYRVYSHKNR